MQVFSLGMLTIIHNIHVVFARSRKLLSVSDGASELDTVLWYGVPPSSVLPSVLTLVRR